MTTIKADFFQVVLKDDDSICPLDSILTAVLRKKPESRTVELDDVPYQVSNLERVNESPQWSGEITRVRMKDLPKRVNKKDPTATKDLDLEENEGLGEGTAFLYDEGSGVLAIQRKMHGTGAGTLLRILKKMQGGPRELEPRPLLKIDAAKTFEDMEKASLFEIKCAGLDASTLASKGQGIGALLDLCNQMDAPKFTFSVSGGGKKKPSLSLKNLRAWVKDLLSSDLAENITSLTVEGDIEGGKHRAIDLIRDRLKGQQEVEDTSGRHLAFANRIDAIQKIWRSALADIERVAQK